MKRVIGIDPGTRLIGWGIIEGRRDFIDCGLARSKAETLQERIHEMVAALPLDHADHLIAEIPQVYRTAKQKGDPRTLVDLSLVLGAVLCAFMEAHGPESTTLVKPHDWKGNAPKSVTEGALIRELTARGVKSFETCLRSLPSSLRHNASDGAQLAMAYARYPRRPHIR